MLFKYLSISDFLWMNTRQHCFNNAIDNHFYNLFHNISLLWYIYFIAYHLNEFLRTFLFWFWFLIFDFWFFIALHISNASSLPPKVNPSLMLRLCSPCTENYPINSALLVISEKWFLLPCYTGSMDFKPFMDGRIFILKKKKKKLICLSVDIILIYKSIIFFLKWKMQKWIIYLYQE